MKIKTLLFALVAIAMASCAGAPEARLNSTAEILPRPTKMTHLDGVYSIDRNTVLCYDESVAKVADILSEYIPFAKRTTECCESNAVRLLVDNTLGKEAYTLKIDASGVTIKGGDYGGVLYGMESLLQLLPYEVFEKNGRLPLAAQFVEIEDSPRFPFRGFMMDMSSDYYTMEELKEFIDIFAIERTSYFAARASSIIYNNLQHLTSYIRWAWLRRPLILLVNLLCLGIIIPILRLVGLINPRGEYHYVLGTGWGRHRFFSRYTFPLGRAKFEGKEYPAPKDTDAYLRTVYGDWRKLPTDEQIRDAIHCPQYIEEIYSKKNPNEE